MEMINKFLGGDNGVVGVYFATTPMSLPSANMIKPMTRITSAGTSPLMHGCKRLMVSLALACKLEPVNRHFRPKRYSVAIFDRGMAA